MAPLNEKELEHLDKQTLISLLISSNASVTALQNTVEQLNKNIDILTEEVRNLRMHRFGRSSERRLVDSDDTIVQLSFAFNEVEVTIDLNPEIPEPSIEEIHPEPYTRSKKKKGKREEELKGLPVTVIEHTLTKELLLECFPGGKWNRLPDEVYKRLEFHPATFEVIEHHVAVYSGNGDQRIIRADRPADLLRNSIATPSLVAGICNYKYVNSQPIHRLAQEFERHDVSIPTQTMCRWTILSADRYFSRLYDRLKEKLFRYHVIHADETPVEVNRDGRPAGSKSYMWVYRSGALEPHPFVLYEYQKTRNGSHPEAFLKGFHGICVTDGYQAYHSLDKKRDDLTVAGCWAHARRDFADVVKTLPEKGKKDAIAYKALQLIQAMYRHENAGKELSADERLKQREKNVGPLVDAFFAYLRSVSPTVAPKCKTGKAIQYCLNQENYLRVFLTDGYVPMDNNAAERGIRTFCLGKNNWYLIDTVTGAQASAILYSIAETAKENSLKPYEYFKYLLEEIPKHGEFDDPSYLDDLLPWSDKLPDICRKGQQSEN